MDKKIRGMIKKGLDEVLERTINDGIRWSRDVISLRSPEDLSLGYVLGSLTRWAQDVVQMEKSKRARQGDEVKEKELTVRESAEIRHILRRKIPEIMEKISLELHR